MGLPGRLPEKERRQSTRDPDGEGSLTVKHWEAAASGLAAAWASENTREAIWDAMARKEVYASTGTRMTVRVFGRWDFVPDDVHRPNFARTGYAGGVPMGGELSKVAKGQAPKFMVHALRDPDGAYLDRIQVIKGWLDKNGESQERIYDVAVSGDRKIGADGRSKEPVGDTVYVENASYTNTIGSARLAAHWEDPEFDPGQLAFYYIRVLEIPTPSWLAYDQKVFGEIEVGESAVMKQQERAYTSPIWYTP